jgi:hypothetical protein
MLSINVTFIIVLVILILSYILDMLYFCLVK